MYKSNNTQVAKQQLRISYQYMHYHTVVFILLSFIISTPVFSTSPSLT